MKRPKCAVASTTARYPAMLAIALSASIFWARVMRGTQSIAKTVAVRAVSLSSSSLFWAGQMKPTSTAPFFSRSGSS